MRRVCCKIMVLQQTFSFGQSLRHGLRRATSLYTREAFGLECSPMLFYKEKFYLYVR